MGAGAGFSTLHREARSAEASKLNKAEKNPLKMSFCRSNSTPTEPYVLLTVLTSRLPGAPQASRLLSPYLLLSQPLWFLAICQSTRHATLLECSFLLVYLHMAHPLIISVSLFKHNYPTLLLSSFILTRSSPYHCEAISHITHYKFSHLSYYP